MIGDVVGKPGRRALEELLPELRRDLGIDLVTVNGENAAGGLGITPDTAEELLACGADVITSGNHIWDKKEIVPHLDSSMPILRPLNYPPAAPGRGYLQLGDVLVVSLLGRVFVGTCDCPFRTMDQLLGDRSGVPKVIIVDMHAEATSEKEAMGWYLDGRVSVVAGTHTHVPTADTRVPPQGDRLRQRSGHGRGDKVRHRRTDRGRAGPVPDPDPEAPPGRNGRPGPF